MVGFPYPRSLNATGASDCARKVSSYIIILYRKTCVYVARRLSSHAGGLQRINAIYSDKMCGP